MVLQQSLRIADVLFSSHEHKGNQALLKHKGRWRAEFQKTAQRTSALCSSVYALISGGELGMETLK